MLGAGTDRQRRQLQRRTAVDAVAGQQLDRHRHVVGAIRLVRVLHRGLRRIRLAQAPRLDGAIPRSEEHTSELQSLMRISYAVFCLKKKNKKRTIHNKTTITKDTHNS